MQVFHLSTWQELKSQVSEVRASIARRESKTHRHSSPLLYRGQGSSDWALETSLDRARSDIDTVHEYYWSLEFAKPMVESLTGRTWPQIDLSEIEQEFRLSTSLFPTPPPAYDLWVHFRHHGFPSPLLDWSRSLFIAAFFAFEAPQSDRVAIYAFQELPLVGPGKTWKDTEPHIVSMDPHVRTHPRHILQQAEYTIAVRRFRGVWHLARHEDVFQRGKRNQDRLWKFTVPRSEARATLTELDEVNINAYSLFQTEDALLRTAAFRVIAPRDA